MFYDLFGALASLLSTYYFIHRDIKAWPIGMLATCLNAWLYGQKGIYADMCLESFYFLSTCYGWYRWSQPSQVVESESLIHLSYKHWGYLLIVIAVLYEIIFNLLISFSHSNVATLDALTTSISLVAQWLMCHKIIATWILWFITDSIYALIYLQKNLPFHALLMIIYIGMALLGYLSWVNIQVSHESNRHKQLS